MDMHSNYKPKFILLYTGGEKILSYIPAAPQQQIQQSPEMQNSDWTIKIVIPILIYPVLFQRFFFHMEHFISCSEETEHIESHT